MRGQTLSDAFVPLMPLPITSPLCTKTQPTGVSSDARANSAISMALRMNFSWYSRLGTGPNTMFATGELAMSREAVEGAVVFSMAFGSGFDEDGGSRLMGLWLISWCFGYLCLSVLLA